MDRVALCTVSWSDVLASTEASVALQITSNHAGEHDPQILHKLVEFMNFSF